ncbi:YicC family protein [Alcanivorax sp. JB21]|uniref:YicC/YloC family endoribonuclease n=1 Tax=Alcanivorax limicola TaxID=2874102 RepID=UPI001CC131BB|nr:YicC/YloC family endoribonuclease [Alcanivorax limicola]MBZ2189063.1 YicC family protein [Alcanivorax limicola]
MIQSMTAFARSDRHIDAQHTTLVWELKSVNHRYLEVSPRLPDAFRELDGPVRELCRKHLNRGKIEIGLRYQADAGEASVSLDEALVQQLGQALHRVGELIHHPAPVSPTEILRMPGVLQMKEVDFSALAKPAMALLEEALTSLVDTRAREGAALTKMVEERLDGILVQVARTRKALPLILDGLRERLKKRVEDILASPDPERLEQELVLLAQKMDVAEELDRLEAHVTEVRRALTEGGHVGRRLDFLMQELNREANTLASKSVDTETTQAAVELKVLIEQMREQIQNIE